MAASWSQDGRWIYFASNRSGDFQIWKMPASGGEPLQVTRAGGFISLESPDGKCLYYNRTVGNRGSLWRVPVDGGEETKVLELVVDRAFAIITEGIYFLTDAGVESAGAQRSLASLQFLSFTTARTRQIATVENPSFGLSVSPDHQWILYSRVVQEGSDLMLVENFR
jgi:Tol biopolymer transport system component